MKKKIKQVHGKEEQFKPSTLDQIWGDTGVYKYSTLDEDKYVSSLKDMNLSDLQAHAIKMGIIPVENRENLNKRLLKEFRTFVASYRFPKTNSTPPAPLSDKALKILSEGR
jgi:hypothetical protein